MIFFKGSGLRCPYCLSKISRRDLQCPVCESYIPPLFIDGKHRKEYIGLAGFTGHGKTVYITVLFFPFK